MRRGASCSSCPRSESRYIPIFYVQTEDFRETYSAWEGSYLCEPSDFLVAGLRNIPFILGGVRDGLQFIVDLAGEFGLVIAVPQLLLIIDAVERLALVAQLHEEVGVVVGLLSVEVDVGWLVYLELLVDTLVHLLLVQTLTVDPHLLSKRKMVPRLGP